MASSMPDNANAANRSSHRAAQTHEEESEVPLPSILHRGQLVIRNEGSVVRDYLAYERNYLAWIKLVVACIVISGGLIIRLHVHETTGDIGDGQSHFEDKIATPMGIIFFIVAVLALISATISYFHIQSDLLKNVGHVSTGRFTQIIGLVASATIATAKNILLHELMGAVFT
ncbi:hypothetical protein P389DRAFT_193795 [Cystobasidium minutum MCA 4210]|uniref:uncharacterized protein n=1 Tax=Cystobasidium minutum MCA 4210 TaxID=1397322 RepID=UPI0034CF2FB8|eukprot:jgi/Rhomi1/193795/gm1.2009_g